MFLRFFLIVRDIRVSFKLALLMCSSGSVHVTIHRSSNCLIDRSSSCPLFLHWGLIPREYVQVSAGHIWKWTDSYISLNRMAIHLLVAIVMGHCTFGRHSVRLSIPANHFCTNCRFEKKRRRFLNSLSLFDILDWALEYSYIRNWSLEPCSQDYWPNFSHRLCCMC